MDKNEEWLISGTQDKQSAHPAPDVRTEAGIDGIIFREASHIRMNNGTLTELLRLEWLPLGDRVDHIFQRVYLPGALSAWHAHKQTTDRLFCLTGELLIVLYDGRARSPTARRVAEFSFGANRPALLVVPPGIWHGIQNAGGEAALMVNMTSLTYNYAEPDHWRLPADTPDIPYKFRT